MESTETFQAQYRDHGETTWVASGAKWNDRSAALRDAEALQEAMPFADVRIAGQHG